MRFHVEEVQAENEDEDRSGIGDETRRGGPSEIDIADERGYTEQTTLAVSES